ncbi:MAG: hypothetical protein AAGG48_30565 [Planctomycetota bacterium]
MHRALLIALLVAGISSATSRVTYAQDNSNSDQDQSITPASVFGGVFGDSMQAQLTEMATKVIDGYLDYLAKPETTKKLATFQKNYYDALIEQGFTKEQAFELLLRFGNPLTDGPRAGK